MRSMRYGSWLSAAVLGLAGTAIAVLGRPAGANCTPSWETDVGQPGANNIVRAMVSSGGSLYAGGEFTSIGGVAANRLAQWDGSSWSAAGGGTNGAIFALAEFGGDLYLGGTFTTADGNIARRIARYDGSTFTALSTGVQGVTAAQGQVNAIAAFEGNLVVAGNFLNAGGNAATHIALWNGAAWSPLGTGLNGFATSLIEFGGDLYVGGAFTSAGGVAASRIARWDGTTWSAVGDGFDSTVFALAVFNGELYAGGQFANSGATPVSGIARWDGSSWQPVGGGVFGEVNSLAAFDDGDGNALYVGGTIFTAGGGPVSNLTRWNGSFWFDLGGGVDSTALALAEHDGFLYVGGAFTSVAGLSADFIARWGCELAGPVVDPTLSDVDATAEVVSSFGGISTIVVTPRDAVGDLLPPGRTVSLSTSAGTLLGAVIDNGDGTYRQDLEAVEGPLGATVSATVDGVPLDDDASVAFVPVDPALSTIEVSASQVITGQSATITVTPVDDLGDPVGPGFNVAISTTLGTLQGAVSDNGDGTYTQTILADTVGTANITATVDNLPLGNSASLTVLDPSIVGDIVGVDNGGNLIAYLSIQAAVDAADSDNLNTVFIAPGNYDETVSISGKSHLIIEALSAIDPVVVDGFVVIDSNNISIRYFTVDSGFVLPLVGINVAGSGNSEIEILGCTISNATLHGIAVWPGSSNVTIADSVISDSGFNGIDMSLTGGPHLVSGNEISGSGWNGIAIGINVEVTISDNVIVDNGTRPGIGGGRYGISRQRWIFGGNPEQITLLNNTLAGNNGRVVAGRSDTNVQNYDQIIDASDDQSPYTD